MRRNQEQRHLFIEPEGDNYKHIDGTIRDSEDNVVVDVPNELLKEAIRLTRERVKRNNINIRDEKDPLFLEMVRMRTNDLLKQAEKEQKKKRRRESAPEGE